MNRNTLSIQIERYSELLYLQRPSSLLNMFFFFIRKSLFDDSIQILSTVGILFNIRSNFDTYQDLLFNICAKRVV